MTIAEYNLDPRIGVMVRNGANVFYAYVQGYSKPPLEGELADVEVALGIHKQRREIVPPSADEVDPHRNALKGKLRSYDVTITPSVTLYSGSSTFGQSVEQVQAHSRREAEKAVRQQLRDVNGRHGPKYNVVARLSRS